MVDFEELRVLCGLRDAPGELARITLASFTVYLNFNGAGAMLAAALASYVVFDSVIKYLTGNYRYHYHYHHRRPR